METKKKALGRGLEQLFANNVIDFDNFEKEIVTENKNDIRQIKLEEIRSNPHQPRKTFNEDSLQELATSIKEFGIVEPVIVKKSIKGYELVAGERRCKAAKIAGLTEVPAIVKDFTDEEMMEIALIENIQREDLNPIDEAKSVLSKLEDLNQIEELAKKVIKEKLNVRELEKLVNNKDVIKRVPIYKNTPYDNKYNIYERVISDKIGNKVRINKNKIEITFDSVKDLERIMEILNISISED